MGVTYTGILAVGIQIEGKKLHAPRLTRIGNHNFPEEFIFHPKTGEKLWGFHDFTLDGRECLDGKFGPFEVATESAYERDGWKVVVGKVLTQETAHYDQKQKAPIDLANFDFESLKKELKDYLEPFKLWDESKFGTWLLMDVC